MSEIQTTTVSNKKALPFAQTYFHGCKADLALGDFIKVGFNSNYGQEKKANFVFFTSTLDAAIWAAELALGEGKERIYLVEATGDFEDDPDLTNQKFPGNPTLSYRSTSPLRIIASIDQWESHAAVQVQTMKAHLAKLKELGIESLNTPSNQ